MATATLLYVRTGSGGANAAELIPDLGFTVPTGSGWTLLSASDPSDPEGSAGQFTAREIRDSKDLWDLITGGTLEWSKDANIVEAAGDYLGDYMLTQDFTDDFFCLTDGRLAFPSDTTLPVSGVEGEVFWDTDDNTLYIWDGDDWTSSTSSGEDHGNLTGLLDDDHPQYGLLAGDAARNAVTGKYEFSAGQLGLPDWDTVSGLGTNDEGDIAWDSVDDCLYLHDGSDWVNVFCLTASGVEFPTGVSLDHGELDGLLEDDHPQYAEVANNETITETWTFDPTTVTDPPFVIDPETTAPTTNLVDGAIAIVDDILATYDATRGKWLSVDRQQILGARKGNATNIYMRAPDGVAHSETGIRVLRDMTIVGIAAQTDGAETWVFEVRRNDSATVLTSLTLTAVAGDQDTTINIDLDQGDEVQLYVNGTAIKSPVGYIEFAYRF